MKTTPLTLPNGFVGPGGLIIREITIRKLNGDDEDMLRDKDNLRQGNVLDKLMKRVIVQMGDMDDPAVTADLYDKKFLMSDLTFVLVQLRIWSLNPIYRFDYNCPKCGKIGRHSVDLSELRVDEQKEEYRGLDEYSTEVDEYNVIFRPLYVRDGKLLESIKTQYKKEKGTRELLLQIVSVNGAKAHPELLKKMDWDSRNKLRQEFDKVSGGIDNVLEMECAFCESVFKDNLPVHMRDFFFPVADTSPCQTARPFQDSGTTSLSSPSGGDGAPSPSVG